MIVSAPTTAGSSASIHPTTTSRSRSDDSVYRSLPTAWTTLSRKPRCWTHATRSAALAAETVARSASKRALTYASTFPSSCSFQLSGVATLSFFFAFFSALVTYIVSKRNSPARSLALPPLSICVIG